MKIPYIDTHTAGEPTRIFWKGLPFLDNPPPIQSLKDLLSFEELIKKEYDHWRMSLIGEPRGSRPLVGAYYIEGACPSVIFFNHQGHLGMCGHGLIGLVRALSEHHILPEKKELLTPRGPVRFHLDSGTQKVSFENVESFVAYSPLTMLTKKEECFTGSVVFGGNWFYITESPFPIQENQIQNLLEIGMELRENIALLDKKLLGLGKKDTVDHVLFTHQDKAFILCPGSSYDRSPCGTGTSVRLALRAHEGTLSPGQKMEQVGLMGGSFFGSYKWAQADGFKPRIIPTVEGEAHMVAQGMLIFENEDPLKGGFLLP